MLLTLDEVKHILTIERRYQTLRWGNADGTENKHTPGNWIKFLEWHMLKANEAFSTQTGVAGAMVELRKVTAICIRVQEEHHGATTEAVLDVQVPEAAIENADIGEYLCSIDEELHRGKYKAIGVARGNKHDVAHRIAALGIRAMMEFGCQPRMIYRPVINLQRPDDLQKFRVIEEINWKGRNLPADTELEFNPKTESFVAWELKAANLHFSVDVLYPHFHKLERVA